MKINAKKLARQKQVISKFSNKYNGLGVFEACTGFGKTYVAILLILKLNKNIPDAPIIVVVPKINLKDDWERPKTGHIDKHNLKNVSVFVINTYINSKWKCKFLIVDEVHHILSEEALEFKKVLYITHFDYFLGLSATLNHKEKQYLFRTGISIIDTVTVEEGEREGYISKSHVYNLSVKLDEKEVENMEKLDKIINYNFARFENNFSLVFACSGPKDKPTSAEIKNKKHYATCGEFRGMLAKKMGWDNTENHIWSPTNIQKSAIMYVRSIKARKEILYRGDNKLNTVVNLLNKFKDKKTIVFWQTTEMANKLEEVLGKNRCRAYYSDMTSEYYVGDTLVAKAEKVKGKNKKVKTLYKLIDDDNHYFTYEEIRKKFPKGKRRSGAKIQKEALEVFKSKHNNVNVFSVVRAVDEGLDDHDVDFVLLGAYFASKRQDIQRRGRGGRINPNNLDKKTLVVNLYYMDTQESKWLTKKQKGTKNINWIDDYNDVQDPVKVKDVEIVLAKKDEQ